MKTFTITELQRLDLIDLCYSADQYDIDYRDQSKQQLIDLILNAQQEPTQISPLPCSKEEII